MGSFSQTGERPRCVLDYRFDWICPLHFLCLWVFFYRCQPVELRARYANASWQNKYPSTSAYVKEKATKNRKKEEKNSAFKLQTTKRLKAASSSSNSRFPLYCRERYWITFSTPSPVKTGATADLKANQTHPIQMQICIIFTHTWIFFFTWKCF